jgi:RNA polymerase sigma factor (sigma-70 family)
MTPKIAIRQTNPDADLVARIGRDDHAAFEVLMRRYNARLFRVARAILKDDAEAEDAVQDAYLEAFRHIGEYRGDAQVSTWLTRIAINQALMRLRRHKRERGVLQFPGDAAGVHQDEGAMMDRRTESPATATLRAEIRKTVERRIDELPAAFRAVFVMRDVEEMTVRRRPTASGFRPPPCEPGCSGRARCCATRWRATSTRPRSRSSGSPASAAIASSGACSPRSARADRRAGTSPVRASSNP